MGGVRIPTSEANRNGRGEPRKKSPIQTGY